MCIKMRCDSGVPSISRQALTGVGADLVPLSSSSSCSRRSLSSDIRLYVSCSAFLASTLTACSRQQLFAASTEAGVIVQIQRSYIKNEPILHKKYGHAGLQFFDRKTLTETNFLQQVQLGLGGSIQHGIFCFN